MRTVKIIMMMLGSSQSLGNILDGNRRPRLAQEHFVGAFSASSCPEIEALSEFSF
jgi:hypothetical protein